MTPGSNGAPPSVAETDEVDSVNLAAGPVLTFFDDAVQVSLGWNLSVDRKRRFWGLGSSFHRVPGLIANATGREQAVADAGTD